jgi:uncharacterized protein (TIGR03435 family)
MTARGSARTMGPTVCASAIGLILWFVVIDAARIDAQVRPSAGQAPAFDVASVRPRHDQIDRYEFRTLPTGSVRFINAPLEALILRAYGIDPIVRRFKLISDRRFRTLLATRYDVLATAPADTSQDLQNEMLRTLLMDRFQLRIRSETRPTSIYALTRGSTGKLGPDIRQSNRDCAAFRKARLANPDIEEPRDVYGALLCTVPYDMHQPKPGAHRMRDGGPIGALTRRLEGFVDRPIVDATGLSGTYDWVVTFSMNPAETEVPSVFQALQDRLGLKLEPRKASLEVFVIDSVEPPTPN